MYICMYAECEIEASWKGVGQALGLNLCANALCVCIYVCMQNVKLQRLGKELVKLLG